MRTKRQQKRRLKDRAVPTGYPDLFGDANPEIVSYEVWREDMCPCCLERVTEKEEYAWAKAMFEWARNYEIEQEIRWDWIPEHGPYCFCTDCGESREHAGEDYDEWRRAFPGLPWD